jgi:hypothetical protein
VISEESKLTEASTDYRWVKEVQRIGLEPKKEFFNELESTDMTEQFFMDHSVLIPGPSFRIDLAPLDALHPVHYSRRLLIFRCDSSAQRAAQLAALKIGLQDLVSRCPILGGIISPLPPDEAHDVQEDWRTILPGQGLELVVRDLRTKLISFAELERANFPPVQLPYDLLVPVPQNISNNRPYAACKIQFSSIEGGTIITLAHSHTVADGVGTNELMRILSEATRLAQGDNNDVSANEGHPTTASSVIGNDRSFMRNITSETTFNIEQHPAYTIQETHEDQFHPFKAKSPEISVLLHISAVNLAQLKCDASTPDAAPISTHDALVALMWRTVLLIRSRRSAQSQAMPDSTIGSMFMPSDARRQLNLPSSYIGNAVYQLTAALPLAILFSPSGLQAAASAVRAAIVAATPTIVHSLMAETNKRWLPWAFLGSYSTTGMGTGTDWTSGEVYSQDWGPAFGPLARYRYPGEEGTNCVMPKLPDGGAEVFVSVMPQEVEMLRGPEGFGKYLEV